MKKIILLILAAISISSCTNQQRAKSFGGNTTIELPEGYRLVEATWKDNGNLWYLIERHDSTYKPSVKEFIESSSWGVMEGKVIFVEK